MLFCLSGHDFWGVCSFKSVSQSKPWGLTLIKFWIAMQLLLTKVHSARYLKPTNERNCRKGLSLPLSFIFVHLETWMASAWVRVGAVIHNVNCEVIRAEKFTSIRPRIVLKLNLIAVATSRQLFWRWHCKRLICDLNEQLILLERNE